MSLLSGKVNVQRLHRNTITYHSIPNIVLPNEVAGNIISKAHRTWINPIALYNYTSYKMEQVLLYVFINNSDYCQHACNLSCLLLQVQLLFYVHSLAGELDPSSWTMCPAEAVKLDLLTVLPILLAFITVSTLKMLGFGVEIVSALLLVIGLYTGVIL